MEERRLTDEVGDGLLRKNRCERREENATIPRGSINPVIRARRAYYEEDLEGLIVCLFAKASSRSV
jgi:hypothetical protein